MHNAITNRIRFLFQTSPEIEALPLHQRPRFLAAVIGGLLLCKFGIMLTISPEAGLSLLPLTLGGGAIATAWRYRALHRQPGHSGPGLAPARVISSFRV